MSINKNNKPKIKDLVKAKTLHQMVLDEPDTYIGSVQLDNKDLYIYDKDLNKIIFKKDCEVVMGLYKIFDEILVNALDNTVRDKRCDVIKVKIDRKTGIIEIENNGSTIPIGIHEDTKIYAPEMIFTKFLTSGNYDKKGKITGGKNGLGSKLTCAYSDWFEIDIVDTERRLKYSQRYSNNLFKIDEPKIEKISKTIKDGITKIKFLPDYKRFELKKGLNDDMYNLLTKRVYDAAGTTNSNVKVYFNDELININSFEEYMELYFEDHNKLISQKYNERWSVGVMYDPNTSFHQMSFVNNIATFKGGTHMNHILDQIIKKVTVEVKKKNKDLVIKPSQIKDNLMIFINSIIEDPKFGSQSKEELTTKKSDFNKNFKCEIDDKFIGKICKSGLLDKLTNIAQVNQEKVVDKTLSGAKTTITHEKLTDAKYAGTKNGYKCALILTEGDSALATAKAGLDKLGREYYGAFPLKGKPLNVREASDTQILNNEEIKNIMRIIGVNHKMKYEDTKKLRYGKIIILTDQDLDGFHIKGLLMNFFHYFCPSLLKIDGFLQTIATPIVKIHKKTDTKKKNAISFLTEREYNIWEKEHESKLGYYNIKYYKGLGTLDQKEAKEIFDKFDDNYVNYVWGNINNNDNESTNSSVDEKKKKKKNSISQNMSNDKSDNAITLAFDKSYADNRKAWLTEHDSNKYIDNNERNVTYHDYVDKEFILFSKYDNIRSIPSIMDGLKPSQRKIMYGAFKRNLTNEIKVAQLAGYVSEHSGYHHGEASLHSTIISMAQDFCGSNNISLLKPCGQFGTREFGGKNAASPRYIFTVLPNIVRKIFIKDDEYILERQFEEGCEIEPKTYYPIIPLLLVNGSDGIGTGWSTNIPRFNPINIVENLKLYINGTKIENLPDLEPWSCGFTGKIIKKDSTKYECYGNYKIISENSIEITELPIETWTNSYYVNFNEHKKDKKSGVAQPNLCENLGINDFDKTYSTNNNVNIKVTFNNNVLQQMIKNDEINKKLKLTSSINLTNMHVFVNNIITKYNDPNEILEVFAIERLKIYKKRKDYVTKIYENKLQLLIWKRKFMKEVENDTIAFGKNIKKSSIIEELEKKEYPKLAFNIEDNTSYNYLTDIKMFDFTKEYIDNLDEEIKKRKETLKIYKNKTPKDLWIEELDDFLQEYKIYMKEWYETYDENDNEDKKKKSKKDKKSKNDKK